MALDRARRALIRTFPYGVYYMVVEENPVHTSLIVEHRLAEAYDGHLDGYPGEVRMGKSYSIAEARDNLARIVRESEAGPVTLTRRGRTVAILVSLDDFERLCGREASFWDRLVAFRKAENVERAGIEADVFDGLRDRDPGRTVQW